MALTDGRNTPRRDAEVFAYPLAAGAVAYEGGIAVAEGGYATPGRAAAGLIVLGRFEERRSNAGGNAGDASVLVRRKGAFLWDNSASDPVTAASIGSACYVEDDHTVAATDGGHARSPAGIVVAADDDGVWVDVQAVPAGPRILRATAQLDYDSLAVQGHAHKDIDVPGAAVGDPVALGLPASPGAGLVYVAFVHEAGKVRVRAANPTDAAVDADEGTFTVAVLKG